MGANESAMRLDASAGTPATSIGGDESAVDVMQRTGSEEFSHSSPAAHPNPKKTTATTTPQKKPPPYRLLTLEGQTGAVFCRVHDTRAQRTMPSLSDAGRFECATRSLLRMFNLAVFRGRDRAGSMVGPGDYFCNVERPHASLFTIEIGPDWAAGSPLPRFVPHPLPPDSHDDGEDGGDAKKPPTRRPVITGVDTAVVPAKWVSGQSNPAEVARLVAAHRQCGRGGKADPFGGSLFPNPGLLLIDVEDDDGGQQHGGQQQGGRARIDLPAVDATTLDLSGFNARLVRNDGAPFRLADAPLAAKDEFRPVSYDFGERYAEHCVEAGAGGLFLETHTFTQTMTPLDAHACGFITLGRWVDGVGVGAGAATAAGPVLLELIAVRIPFGWTIIVDSGCMHGDSTFVGTYMMSMTSNHVTMESADTVFLKRMSSLSTNVDLRCDAHRTPAGPRAAPRPIVCFSEPTEAELQAFRAETAGISFMLQPFSKLSWATTIYRRFSWYPATTTTTTTTTATTTTMTAAAGED